MTVKGKPLDKLTLKGFKSIKKLEDFELRSLNVLVGANGAGKSNFVDFFRMLSAMMKEGGLKEFIAGQADGYLFGGPLTTPEMKVEMVFGPNGYDFTLYPNDDGFFVIKDERRHYFPKDYTRNFGTVAFDPELLRDKDSPGVYGKRSASWYTYEYINSWQIYHFHETGKNMGARRYCDLNHKTKLASDASNLPAFLHYLLHKRNEQYQEMLDAVRLAIPFLDNFILEPTDDERIRLMWRQKGLNDFPMRPTSLSDGSIRFICLATALLQPFPPSTIIIDEPELGLHPEAIRILGELIRDCSKRTQVILSTQSPLLIDEFEVEDIVVVKRKDGQSTFNRLDRCEFDVWLEDYSVGELWTKNVIQGGTSYE